MSSLKDDLRARSEVFVETHISWVSISGTLVHKVKRPVALGFLDFSTLEKRREACDAEVRLNRRLAPDVYRAVVPITRDSRGVHHVGGEGEPVDWAVEMVRLPDADRADVRLREHRLEARHIDALAAHVAAFHAEAGHDDRVARFGAPEIVETNVRENFEQTRAAIGEYLGPEEAAEVEAWQLDMLRVHRDAFEERVRAGRIRDGHGDLRLEHVYVDERDRIRIIDCIEFNDRFRFGDVCADVAFLAMDLAWHGRVDLAERFLAIYAREADDYDLYRLVDFYESYRAWVRAKVAGFLAADPSADAEARERAREEARRYFLLALACGREPCVAPILVAVGGVIASGKSTVADSVGLALGAPVVGTDRTRKRLLGVAPTEKLHDAEWAGAYARATTDRVYAEVLRRADVVLGSGRPAIVDASFRSAESRRAARELARKHGVRFLFVECRVDHAVCRERLRRRALGQSVSDGRLEIFDAFVARWEDVTELPEEEHLIVDTSGAPETSLRAVQARLS